MSDDLVKEVETLYPDGRDAPAGHYRIVRNTPGGHPGDGMTAIVSMGDGAVTSIINPQSFENGGPEWTMRYGNPMAIRYVVAGLLESYDYLLSGNINLKEATRRLRLLRGARSALKNKEA